MGGLRIHKCKQQLLPLLTTLDPSKSPRLSSSPFRHPFEEATTAMATSTALEHVRGVWERMRGNSPIYDFLLPDVVLISATQGSITAHLTLGKNHVNSRGTIHGAVSAALVDWSGGLAIATHGLEKTGASVDIHVTYIGTAQAGRLLRSMLLQTRWADRWLSQPLGSARWLMASQGLWLQRPRTPNLSRSQSNDNGKINWSSLQFLAGLELKH